MLTQCSFFNQELTWQVKNYL